MSYTPVISQNEPVISVICPHCSGAALVVIERFLAGEDKREIERLRSDSYRVMTSSLKHSSVQESCRCRKGEESRPKPELAARKAPVTPARSASGRPVLSMNKRGGMDL